MGEMESAPDASLVRRVQAGDSEAFGALVGRYMRAAYAVSLSVTGRHDDAEDAAQEGFMVALERLDDCRTPDRFAGWLLTIVRNRARNLVRREVLRDTDAVPETAAARGRTPEKATEHAELQERLGRALQRAFGGSKRDRAPARSRGLEASRDCGAPWNPFWDRAIAPPLCETGFAAGLGSSTGRHRR